MFIFCIYFFFLSVTSTPTSACSGVLPTASEMTPFRRPRGARAGFLKSCDPKKVISPGFPSYVNRPADGSRCRAARPRRMRAGPRLLDPPGC